MSKKLIWILGIVMVATVVWMISIQASWIRTSFTMRQHEFSEKVMQSLSGVVEELERREVIEQLSNEVLALNFDTAAPARHLDVTLPAPEIVRNIVKDADSTHTLVVMAKDSLFYPVADPQGGPMKADTDSMDLRQLREEVQRRVHTEKTVFVEKILNNITSKKVNLEERVSPSEICDILCKQFKMQGIVSEYEFMVLKDDHNVYFKTDGFAPSEDDKIYEILLFPNDLLSQNTKLTVYFPDEISISMASLTKNVWMSFFLALIIIVIFFSTLLIIMRQRKLHEMKTDFINNMTHELKTPIASISLASQMLRDPSVAKNQSSFTNISSVIEEESKRLGSQVERVLQMAAIDRGKLLMKTKEVYINDVVRKVVKTFDLKLKAKDGVITCKYGAKDDLVEGDEMHITNIVANLLDNALKYTEIKPELKITTSNVKNGVELEVEDNGIGISRENQRRIFEQFFRVHTGNIHNTKGFGIGLSYVKKIVEAHGGTIRLKSEPGRGSTFTVFLPFSQ